MNNEPGNAFSTKTQILCPLCWTTCHPVSDASRQLCEMCRQMTGRAPLRSLTDVTNHYYDLICNPEIPMTLKTYVNQATIDAIV